MTGSHSFKAGYQGAYMIAKTPGFVGQQISYRFNNGVPNQLTQRLGPTLTQQPHGARRASSSRISGRAARLTLQGGLRYEHVHSFFPEGENGVIEAHRFGPAFTFPRTDGVRGYNDITPRMGASYDLFGNGKTALKVSMSKYLQAPYNGDVYTINNPAVTLRADDEPRLDRHDLPIGDPRELRRRVRLHESRRQRRMPGVDQSELGPAGADDAGQSGRAGRLGQAQLGLAVQRRRPARDRCRACRWTSATAAGGGATSSSRTTARSTAQDYDEVTLTAPIDPRLPGGGGYPVTLPRRATTTRCSA